MVNLATTKYYQGYDILRYLTACFSGFCEYFVNTTNRIRNAAFSALRIMFTQCLKKEYFTSSYKQSGLTSEILSLDALTLDEEISSMRKGKGSMSNSDKLVIFLRYIMASRFEEA